MMETDDATFSFDSQLHRWIMPHTGQYFTAVSRPSTRSQPSRPHTLQAKRTDNRVPAGDDAGNDIGSRPRSLLLTTASADAPDASSDEGDWITSLKGRPAAARSILIPGCGWLLPKLFSLTSADATGLPYSTIGAASTVDGPCVSTDPADVTTRSTERREGSAAASHDSTLGDDSLG